ncbi:MAG: winged helix-turn-helix domain-containing protein, partial [Pseudomonadota bacterium]
KTLARRPPQMSLEATERVIGDLRLDRVGHRAERGGQPLDLSPLEFKLLDCLMAHEGEVVTRTMLLEKVWGYAFDPKTSLVQTHLSRLRAKVDRGRETELIRTIRGAGYVIAAP